MSQAYHADSSDLTDKEILTWDTFGQSARSSPRPSPTPTTIPRSSSRSPAADSFPPVHWPMPWG